MAKAERIRQEGFLPWACFTPNIDDAVYYAAIGGEDDLQRREEEWEAVNGYPPREDYGPELWNLFEDLYPKSDQPVVVVVDGEIMSLGEPDPGADQGVRFNKAICAGTIAEVAIVDWDLVDQIEYDPTTRDIRAASA